MTSVLEEEYSKLLEEKRKLQKQIYDINEKELLACARVDNQYNQDLLFRKIPLRYTNTTFCTARAVLTNYISATFLKRDILSIIGKIDNSNTYRVHYFALLCTHIVNTDKGVVLYLEDPYRRIKTYPLTKISYDQAATFISRMLIVKLRITKDALVNSEFYAENIKVLKYTRNGKFNGKRVETLINPMYKVLCHAEKEDTEKHHIEHLDKFEKYFIKHKFCVNRESSLILHVCSLEYKFSLSIQNDYIYCIVDDVSDITDLDIEFLSGCKEYLIATAKYSKLVYNND